MPNVLLLCEYATLNGGERSMLATLDWLAKAGWVPVVAAPPGGPLAEELRTRGVEAVAFSVTDAAGRRLPRHRLREDLASLLGRLQPEILHANSLSMGRLSGPVAAEGNVPSIAHLRDIVRLSAQAVADLNCHDRLLAVSHAVRAFHAAGGLAAGKLHVVYNGIHLEEFRPRPPTGALHRELGLPSGAPLVATIGQIGPRKGQDVLVRAVSRLGSRRPDAHVLVIGQRYSEKAESRRFEADLRAAASAGGRVHFLGLRRDVARLLNEVVLLVHPARQEPLGRVLLEAAASGVPVVATAVGGTGEIFAPGTARLVPPDDPTALAGAIDELLGDAALRAALAAAARRRAEAVFDIRKTAAAMVEHYEAVRQCSPVRGATGRSAP
jgi:glycosyltransferase involved in cell wall biosynthesis